MHPQPSDWQNWASMATTGQPFLSFLAIIAAILAAVLTPRIAARIEERRWRATALRLATLLCEAIDVVAMRFGASGEQDIHELQRTSDTLNLSALVIRCEAWPSDSIGGPEALDAFIRMTGVGRAILDIQPRIGVALSVDQAVRVLETMPRLRDRAHEELDLLRRSLGHRISIKV